MAWLPHGEKIPKISLFVLAQLTNVTDGQTDGHRVMAIAALCIASHGKNDDFRPISRSISQTVIVRWAHAARQFVSIEFTFRPYNI